MSLAYVDKGKRSDNGVLRVLRLGYNDMHIPFYNKSPFIFIFKVYRFIS